MQINRREFSKLAAGAGLAATGISAAAKTAGGQQKEPATVPIIDTHQHLWDLSKFELPWLESVPELNHSHVTKDYLAAASGLNVVKTVYMEVDVAPQQQAAEAEHVIALCKNKHVPTAGAVIAGRPASDEFKPYIAQFKDGPYVKGVRQVLHVPGAPAGTCLGGQFVESMRLLGELGMSFDLCMRPDELMDGAKLADRCRETRFIVDHCGNADPKAFGAAGNKQVEEASHKAEPWRRAIGELARRKNVVCKISGIVVRAPKETWTAEQLAPIVNHCLDEFGPERVIFGSDWPVCTLVTSLKKWVGALQEIVAHRTAEHQRLLFHDNAARLYGLT